MNWRYVLLALFLADAVPSPTSACSCLPYYSNASEALPDSKWVFTGKVVSIQIVTVPTTIYSEENGTLVPSVTMRRQALVTLETIEEWKGDGSSKYIVVAGAPPDPPLPEGMVLVNCELKLDVDKTYLVFAMGDPPAAGYCTPTTGLENAKDLIRELNQLQGQQKKNR